MKEGRSTRKKGRATRMEGRATRKEGPATQKEGPATSKEGRVTRKEGRSHVGTDGLTSAERCSTSAVDCFVREGPTFPPRNLRDFVAEDEKAPKSMLYGDEVLKVYDLAVV